METNVKPVFLLADSQILFWRAKEGVFLDRVKRLMEEDNEAPYKAAYIGASNGDKPEYYDIFLSAMSQVGLEGDQCRMIPSDPSEEDMAFLEEANLILLAGGDIEPGWEIIKEKFQQTIVDRYYKGAVLIGISAGAVQLGTRGWTEEQKVPDSLFETFQLVPAVVDVHNEESDWEHVRAVVEHLGGYNRGFGIPSGGAAAYHPDWSFEAIRHHLVEFFFDKKELKRSLVLPKETNTLESPADPTPSRIVKQEDIPDLINMEEPEEE